MGKGGKSRKKRKVSAAVKEAGGLNFYEKLREKVRRGGYTGSCGEGKRRRRERKVVLLLELTEEQRAEAYKRYEVVRGGGEEEIRQRVIAREHGEPVKTLQWWVRKSREAGLCGLARLPRSA